MDSLTIFIPTLLGNTLITACNFIFTEADLHQAVICSLSFLRDVCLVLMLPSHASVLKAVHIVPLVSFEADMQQDTAHDVGSGPEGGPCPRSLQGRKSGIHSP